ncbi:MAG: DUF1570 domain-containing protein [Planctomycetales bacterium]|nr:DUF1570 domain-containing protein [Planctomycetales bacterium]
MVFRLSIIVAVCLLLTRLHPCSAGDESTWKLTLGEPKSTVLTGRIVAEIPNSAVLLEERNGRLHQISAGQIQAREDTAEPFVRITETAHYVVCSNSAPEYVEFCGKLLEVVFDQYFLFMAEQKIEVTAPIQRLPIVIFASSGEFQTFAAKQHPEISFADTPGYYSVTDNQTLLLDLTGDRSVRSASTIRRRLSEKPLQVATVVHEAVHQLAFNSGLQVRMADNPLWISEGLAMYFETTSSRSSLLWNRPGLVNRRHQPGFMKLLDDHHVSGTMNTLIESDSAFMDSAEMPAAYGKAWALTHFLVREKKVEMQKYLVTLSQRKPMVGLNDAARTQEFLAAFGKLPDEMEEELVSYIRRQRVPK